MDQRVTLQGDGFDVLLSSFGATIVELNIVDKEGKKEDCVLGFDTVQEYSRESRDENPYFGCVVGRVANRIGGASFVLDGQEYKLNVNCGDKDHLHGGNFGLSKRNW